MTLTELRKELKERGYGVSIKTLSFGKSATYKHLESKEMLTFNCASAEHWVKWTPLLVYLKANVERLKTIKDEFGERIGGLLGPSI